MKIFKIILAVLVFAKIAFAGEIKGLPQKDLEELVIQQSRDNGEICGLYYSDSNFDDSKYIVYVYEVEGKYYGYIVADFYGIPAFVDGKNKDDRLKTRLNIGSLLFGDLEESATYNGDYNLNGGEIYDFTTGKSFYIKGYYKNRSLGLLLSIDRTGFLGQSIIYKKLNEDQAKIYAPLVVNDKMIFSTAYLENRAANLAISAPSNLIKPPKGIDFATISLDQNEISGIYRSKDGNYYIGKNANNAVYIYKLAVDINQKSPTKGQKIKEKIDYKSELVAYHLVKNPKKSEKYAKGFYIKKIKSKSTTYHAKALFNAGNFELKYSKDILVLFGKSLKLSKIIDKKEIEKFKYYFAMPKLGN